MASLDFIILYMVPKVLPPDGDQPLKLPFPTGFCQYIRDYFVNVPDSVHVQRSYINNIISLFLQVQIVHVYPNWLFS